MVTVRSEKQLLIDGLTLEGFFDRGQVLLTLLRDGQVVSRLSRDLNLGCFALTVESGESRWTLEVDGTFRSWQRKGGGTTEGTPLRGWLLQARGSLAQKSWPLVFGLVVGVMSYSLIGALFILWNGNTPVWTTGAALCVGIAAWEVYLVRELRKHLDRQAELVVSV